MTQQLKKIAIASDHAGFKLKQKVKNYLDNKGIEYYDFGTHSEESSDYPDYVHPLATSIKEDTFELGIVLCGSGNGVAITANKHQHIRCALCWNTELASLAKRHNNANVLALPARFIDEDLALKIADTFLETAFEGGRHQERVQKISCG